MYRIAFFTLTLATALAAGECRAADASYLIEVKNGAFVPATLDVPASQKFSLTVKNNDAVEAEFESYTLDREEKIDSGEQTELFLGPLEAGEYEFFDDNNPSAKGVLVAR